MRLGDYIVTISMCLNLSAMCLYAVQGHWPNALYWFAALLLNGSLLWGMR